MKVLVPLISFFLVLVFMPSQVSAQSDNHTAREEAEGKAIWGKLQVRETSCDKLSDGDFGALGEYYMGQMIGSSHKAMNTMMEQMMGKEGEEQMHVVMGKRLSGCDTSVESPQSGIGFMPMMWTMRGGGNPMMGTGWGDMMGGWNGFGVFGSWLVTLTWFVWLIVGILVVIWLWRQINKKQG